MNSRDVVKLLKSAGFSHVRTSGSHHWFWNETLKRGVSVVHPERDVKLGTLIGYERSTGVKLRKR